MSPDERIELLKAVAACAPKEMGARFYEDRSMGPRIVFRLPQGAAVNLEDLQWTAWGTFAMLDAMEKAGQRFALHPNVDSSYTMLSLNMDGLPSFFGETRAIAVARAFVKVFESTEAK